MKVVGPCVQTTWTAPGYCGATLWNKLPCNLGQSDQTTLLPIRFEDNNHIYFAPYV